MSIVKVIEVIASSEKSIEDALQQAVAEASKTVRNIDSVYVKDIKAHVSEGKISSYGLICKISFRLDEENGGSQKDQHSEKEPVPEENNESSEQQTPSGEGSTSVIQGKPGKETERGSSKSGAGAKPKEGREEVFTPPTPKQDREGQSEQTPHEVATDTSQYKPGDDPQKETAANSKKKPAEASSEEPDDRVEEEEEVSDPENQKDFIPGH